MIPRCGGGCALESESEDLRREVGRAKNRSPPRREPGFGVSSLGSGKNEKSKKTVLRPSSQSMDPSLENGRRTSRAREEERGRDGEEKSELPGLGFRVW